MKLDIEAVRLSDNDRDQPTETYKKSSEFDSNEKSPGKCVIQHQLIGLEKATRVLFDRIARLVKYENCWIECSRHCEYDKLMQ